MARFCRFCPGSSFSHAQAFRGFAQFAADGVLLSLLLAAFPRILRLSQLCTALLEIAVYRRSERRANGRRPERRRRAATSDGVFTTMRVGEIPPRHPSSRTASALAFIKQGRKVSASGPSGPPTGRLPAQLGSFKAREPAVSAWSNCGGQIRAAGGLGK